jgi:AsmA protein
VPDVRRPETASASMTLPGLPAQTFFDWLSVATPHPPTGFSGDGSLGGALTWGAPETEQPPAGPVADRRATATAQNQAAGGALSATWSGELKLSGESLQLPALGPEPLALDDVVLRSTPPAIPPPARARRGMADAADAATIAPDSFDLLPVSLALGGRQPAVLTGHLDRSGYSLHLAGTVIVQRLLALGDAVPQFGDGLRKLLAPETSSVQPAQGAPPESLPVAAGRGRGRAKDAVDAAEAQAESAPVAMDLTVTRAWGGSQVWSQAPAGAPAPRHAHR